MGISQVGVDTIPPQTIVVKKVSNVVTPTTTTQGMEGSGTFIPKGTYSVRVVTEGNTTGGTVTTGGNNPLLTTITTVDAETGRIGPSYIENGLLKDSLILNKDSFAYVSIGAITSGISVSLELIPKKSDAIALPTFTGNTTFTAAATATGGSVNDIAFGGHIPGWDYDNDSPCVIVVNSATSNPSLNQVVRFTSTTIWRFNKNTGKWTSKYFDTISPASDHTFANSQNGLYYTGQNQSPQVMQFFIKGNYLHNLVYQGVLNRTTDSSRWGWMKGNINVGGSTLNMEAGHANIAFAELAANMDQSNTGNRMIYYWDRVSHKVIYNGCKDSVLNGPWGAHGWRHKWGQWDIATDVIDYQTSNGNLDPRIAGSNVDSNLSWRMASPSAVDGKSFAISANGTSNYNARWDRNGTYSGVGNYDYKRPFDSTTFTGQTAYTTFNTGDFTRYGYMVTGSQNGTMTLDHTINSGTGVLLNDTNGFYNTGKPLFRGGVTGNYTVGDGPHQAYLVTNEWIVYAYGGYQKMQGNSTRYTYPITVYMIPVNEINMIRMIQPPGGLPSNRLGTPNSGINPGTWQEITMAYFARVNDNNVVDIVIAVPDEFELNGTGVDYAVEWEGPGNWIQTSFTGRIRGVFARPGYKYNPTSDEFEVAEEPYELPTVEEPANDQSQN